MRLKGIRVNGFKSFADKINLNFSDGITAIVGPNGSGKSNISDAVRWVLGEQSAKMLRGSKMEDVIFSGTQKRNPMGFAEVTLVLDNRDRQLDVAYDEVEVTRKVFVSGESQYMINKTPVRLKDIHEAFMDTGLGRDGYSMVGQGKIDEILSTKSDDRREIFEEAAGISKYRYRKEDAERKLNRTNENLDRVFDIITELEGRVEPLKNQSEKAKKYLQYKEELKTFEVNDAIRIIEGANDVIGGLDAKLSVVTGQLNEAKNSAEKAEHAQQEYYETAKAREESQTETNKQIRELTESISIKKGEIDIAKNTISGNDMLTSRIREEIKTLMDQKVDLENEKAKINKDIEGKKAELEFIDSEIKVLSAQEQSASGGVSDAEKEIDGLNELVAQNIEKLSELKISLSNQKLTEQSYISRRETILSEATDRSEEREGIVAKIEEIDAEISRKAVYLNKIKSEREDINQKREKINSELADNVKTINENTISLNEKISRKKLLENMEQSYDGYSRSVKIVLKEHESGELRGTKIYGPVSKLLKTQDKYSIAIDVALGNAVQNIVVKSEDDAKAAIECLKSRNAGRATFLPLTSIKLKDYPESGIEKEKGYVGVASRLVSCDSKFSDVAEFLLGGTVVIDNIDNAISISRKYKSTVKLVTLTGELFNVGGALSGGSFYKQASLFGRENEIVALSKEIPALEKETEKLTKKNDSLSVELEKYDEELKKYDGEIAENDSELLILARDKSHNQLMVNQIDTAKRRVEEELGRVEEKIDEAVASQKRIEQEIIDTQELISSKQEEIEVKETAISAIIAEKQEISGKILTKNFERSSVVKDIEVLNEKLENTNRDIASNASNTALHETEIKDIEKKNADLAEDIERKIKEPDLGIAKIAELDEAAARLAEERKQLDEADRAALAEIKTLREEVFTLSNEEARLAQRKIKHETELENTINNLWEEYELTYSDAVAYKKDLGTATEVTKEIASLKRKISALGNVNVDAIEEYKAVSERYEFLTGQRDDLVAAQKDLLGIIADMTKVMKNEFTVKFAEIAKYFKQTFVELFGGGTASLSLDDPDDILNCNINIDVQPPGKKLQSLLLLSGGERALSAIALLFAILKTRPTPFCFLDEIEAALDDANVYRFADYIKNYSENTQFIVVTHRRGTMEAADVIYGVTMQEKGVSKLLELNINELAE
ncbi:MAG: chromosome segregation protein SMC [Clostridia bacterium]|nr:chromosome segregation protein SMC [Clostridia bacterium]